jgi:hypothetical protein
MSDVAGGHRENRGRCGACTFDLDHDPAVFVHIDSGSHFVLAAGQVDTHSLSDGAAPISVSVRQRLGIPVRIPPRIHLGGHPAQNRTHQGVSIEHRGLFERE